jgi:hypothetical protein
MIESGTGKVEQGSSFCEQKEAKKLCSWGRGHARATPSGTGFFLPLFFKTDVLA